MNVFAIGTDNRMEELFAKNENIIKAVAAQEILGKINSGDFIIHFWEDESMDDLEELLSLKNVTLLINSLNTTLKEIAVFQNEINVNLLGFAGIPGFINRDKWEVTELKEGGIEKAENFFEFLNIKAVKINDRVGMVSPRVIAMIINEAYYTVMEGTAAKEDIDIAMKLGTNYPEGPFQWLKMIGIEHIYELLDALYEDTKEERYKICPLLKQEYLTAIAD